MFGVRICDEYEWGRTEDRAENGPIIGTQDLLRPKCLTDADGGDNNSKPHLRTGRLLGAADFIDE